MSILLTDEEIGEIFLKEDWACLEECDVRVIAKAQAKKLVEWGNDKCPHRKPHSPKHRCFHCWQILKKEVEDGS